MLITKEHYELMEIFEREHKCKREKEPKELWAKGHIYQNGHVNELFLAFRKGYSLGKALEVTQ